MKFLVTGGAGFIGGHLVEHLVRAGHDVRVLDDLSSGRLENLRNVRDRVDFLLGSITDVAMVRRAVAGVDFVLHQAARTSVVQSVEDPLSTHDESNESSRRSTSTPRVSISVPSDIW